MTLLQILCELYVELANLVVLVVLFGEWSDHAVLAVVLVAFIYGHLCVLTGVVRGVYYLGRKVRKVIEV